MTLSDRLAIWAVVVVGGTFAVAIVDNLATKHRASQFCDALRPGTDVRAVMDSIDQVSGVKWLRGDPARAAIASSQTSYSKGCANRFSVTFEGIIFGEHGCVVALKNRRVETAHLVDLNRNAYAIETCTETIGIR